uniref:SR-rich pre-mRNA splicing activator n=1 Tax=Kalmanozyma brasiliensis (strain GHG001) TaxID=1365824 RepID=V5EBQ7_KALBG
MGDSSYKGVSASQDSRFTDKQSVLLRKLTFPASFSTKVDMTRVELSVIRPWISRRITTLLGFEDDVVLEYATGMLEEERFPDPRKVQIQLMGFLEGQTAGFMEELWELLVSAQESVGGVPRRFVEEKKEELRVKREEGERVVREARERAARAAEAGGARGQEGKRRSRHRLP